MNQTSNNISPLNHLAGLYGFQTDYWDMHHQRKHASVESLLALLQSLRVPVTTVEDAPSAIRERLQRLWARPVEPVVVSWDSRLLEVDIRLPSDMAGAILSCQFKLENGEEHKLECSAADLPVVKTAEIEGIHYLVKRLHLPFSLPFGYHKLIIEAAGWSQDVLAISTPSKGYVSREGVEKRSWGVFLPLYSLHTDKSWGAGSYSDLEALMDWTTAMEGDVIATLPLLSTFLDGIFEPSPYRPASRLLWNEFYLDVCRIPELKRYATVEALIETPSFKKEIESLRKSSLVDYRRQMRLKRRVLEELSILFFNDKNYQRLHDFENFINENPIVEEYARFQATCEKQHTPWHSWPERLRKGVLEEADFDEKDRCYHLYAQWLTRNQMDNISNKARDQGLKLYLDLPVGVHPDGYDVWREPETFILDTSVGAPPDIVFTNGQNWGFPPLHPDRIRDQGYRYTIAYLRHHLRSSHILRIDHVMGLHRLFCIPKGIESDQGVYMHYRHEELYAILSLESYRSGTIIVGEDLGMVPSYVRPAMEQHGFHRMYILHYEMAGCLPNELSTIPHNSVASLNTHDMPTFAAFWEGLDIEERRRLNFLDEEKAQKERKIRQDAKLSLIGLLKRNGWLEGNDADAISVLKGCISLLANSQAGIVLLNLEDLWLEIDSQNIPGTTVEHPNWQRKARYSLDEFCKLPQVIEMLHSINILRK